VVFGLAAAREGLDDDHAAAAAATWTRQHTGVRRQLRSRTFGLFRPGRHGEQLARPRDVGGAMAVGEQSIVADAVQTLGEHVRQKKPRATGWPRNNSGAVEVAQSQGPDISCIPWTRARTRPMEKATSKKILR
jgi:hypothetical protein